MKYIFENGREIKHHASCDYYFNGFLTNILLQDSCYKCMYSKHSRVGDLTIGDFIGFNRKILDDTQKKRNISVVMINTEKGQQIVTMSEGQMYMLEQDVKIGLRGPSFNGASKPNAIREEFRRDYLKIGYYNAIRKHTNIIVVRNCIKFHIKYFVKIILGRT